MQPTGSADRKLSDGCEPAPGLPLPRRPPGRDKTTPLGARGCTVQLEIGAETRASFGFGQVAGCSIDGGELLQAWHPPEPLQRSLRSSERKVGILPARLFGRRDADPRSRVLPPAARSRRLFCSQLPRLPAPSLRAASPVWSGDRASASTIPAAPTRRCDCPSTSAYRPIGSSTSCSPSSSWCPLSTGPPG